MRAPMAATVTEEDLRQAAFTGVTVYAGLGAGLLVTLVVMAPIVQSVAFDAGLPLGITDARLLLYGYPVLVAALALLGATVTGLEYGRTHPVEPVPHIVHALVTGVIGLILLLILGHLGALIGAALVALPAETATLGAATLGLAFLLVIPVLVAGVVTSLLVAHLADETGIGVSAPQAARARRARTREAAAAGGGGRGGATPGAQTEEAEEAEAAKRLKCPSCSNIFRTVVREGEDIVCPECGYTAQTTAAG